VPPDIRRREPGLPDGLLSNQKNPNLGKFVGPFEWKMLYIYNHLEYFMDIWYIL
jgi:hypothetical protein